MRRTLTKFLTLLLAVLMCVSLLAGCGGGVAPQEQAGHGEQAVPAESYKVGVVVYDNTDLLQQGINKYLTEYIGPAFNVEFIISDAIKDSNQEISFLENCAAKGAKGIIAVYQVTYKKVLFDKIKELGMYYVSTSTEEKDFEFAKGNPYYVGGVNSSKADYTSAYNMTTYFLENGARKLGAATGGVNFGIKMFVERERGIKDAIKDFEAKNPGEKITLDSFDGFPNDAWFASQAKMIASDPDAILANFSGEFLWLQPLIDSGKAGKIKLGTISNINPVAAQAVNDGNLNYLGAIYPEMTGIQFALLYNAMTGHREDYRDNGNPAMIITENIEIKSPEEMKKWMEVLNGPIPPYSAEDLKKVIKAFNPDAALQDLTELANANGFEDIKARRAAD